MLFSDSTIENFIDNAENQFQINILKILRKYKNKFSDTIKSHITFNEEIHTVALITSLIHDCLASNNKTFSAIETQRWLIKLYKEFLDYDDNSYYIEELTELYEEYFYSEWDEDFGPVRFIWTDYLRNDESANRIKENMTSISFWRIFSVYCDILPNPNLATMGNVRYSYLDGLPSRHDPYLSYCYTHNSVVPLIQVAIEFNKEMESISDSVKI